MPANRLFVRLELCAFFLMLASLVAPVRLAAQEAPQLDYPLSAAVSPNGAVFLADRNLPGIWRVEAGQLSLYFQASKRFRTPLNAVRCVAFDRQGRLLAGDTSSREIYRFDADGQPQPLIGNQVGIGVPMSLAVNQAGEIFVADLETHRIWKIPDAGGEPVEFAAVPAPRGLFIDGQDRLWAVCQAKDFQVVRYAPTGERETIVAGRPFQFPHNLVVDASDVCYVSDGYAKTIWRVAPGGMPEALVAGGPLTNPVGLAWEGENLLVVDPRAQQKLFRVTPGGDIAAVEYAVARSDPAWFGQASAQREPRAERRLGGAFAIQSGAWSQARRTR